MQHQQDPLQMFKNQIEAMFDKTFNDLSLKNNLNKTILNNLISAAQDQSAKISQLDSQISSLRGLSYPQNHNLHHNLNLQQDQIHQRFNFMMQKLTHLEQKLNYTRSALSKQLNQQSSLENKLSYMTNTLQKLEHDNHVTQAPTQSQLIQSINHFEQLLEMAQQQTLTLSKNLQFQQQLHLQQPLNSFQTKMVLHHGNNQQILQQKLTEFQQRLKKIETQTQQTNHLLNQQQSQAQNSQTHLIEQTHLLEKEMVDIRQSLQNCDQRRKQTLQSHAHTLDNLVEQMLVEAKQLELRVENLRKGYEEQRHKN